MIRLSRIFARFQLAGLLLVVLFSVPSRCLATGLEKQEISAQAAFGCDLSHLVRCESSQQMNTDSSCLNVVGIWWQVTSHRSYRMAHEMADRGTAIVASCHRWQLSQQNWIRESVSFAFVRYGSDLDQLATSWLTQGLLSGGPADRSLVARDKIDRSSSVDQEIDQQSAYWTYYQDCERWGVELAQELQLHPLEKERAEDLVPIPNEATPVVNRSETDLTESTGMVVFTINRMSRWIGQALKHIEFSAIESQVWSRAEIVKQAD